MSGDRRPATQVRNATLLACTVALLLALTSVSSSTPNFAGAAVVTGPNTPITTPMFTSRNPWNADVSSLPVHPLSGTYLASMGLDTEVHADFGTVWNGAPNGIPYVLVRGTQPKVPVTFYYADESDPGPYPIPTNAPIEGGPNGTGDRHILTLDVDNQRLYEVYDAHYNSTLRRWEAGSGAIWDLTANPVRPDTWTSADAAGLPMLPGLVRYDEVKRGAITHALRFTVPQTQQAYVFPGSHFASWSEDTSLPPMGLRVRLRADYDISGFPADVQVILRALKKYGMIVADNGGPWYVSGAPDPRWDDDLLHTISRVQGRDFEVVDTTSLEPVAPLIYCGRSAPLRRGQTLARWGCFADPGSDGWTATVNYGDGSYTKKLPILEDQRFRLSHRYTRAGTFSARIRVSDREGHTALKTLRVVVSR